MLPTSTSEYEPLISNKSNKRISLSNSIRSSYNKIPIKPIIAAFILLVITGFIVYAIYPRNNILNSSTISPKLTNWVQMESAHPNSRKIPKAWAQKQECDEQRPFTLTLALKQQNTDRLHEHVTDVSHPSNKDTYHKYWSASQVRSYFAPTSESISIVKEWLNSYGFTEDNGKVLLPYSSKGNIIRVSLTCGDANKLLNTKYLEYENKINGKTHLRVENGIYSLPDNIYQHIDFMSPTLRFPLQKHTLTVQSMSERQLNKLNLKSKIKSDMQENKIPFDIQTYGNRNKNKNGNNDGNDGNDDDDDSIDYNPNTPDRLNQLYNMDLSLDDIIGDQDELDSTVCRQAIASFIEQYYDDDDLNLFWTDLDVTLQSPMERVPSTQPDGFGSEAELDTQYITSTGKGIYTYVYYIDSDDIFVSLAEAILDSDIPPLVVSISYGADEYELGQDWVERCNVEFGKLALIGTTVLASSGDSGALGNDEDCYNPNDDGWSDIPDNSGVKGHTPVSGKGKTGTKGKSSSSVASDDDYTFVASFPATALYVTSVGGTTGGMVQDDVDTATGEEAWLYSGGGFSIYFDAPDWQTNAINNYLNSDITLPSSSRYTSTGRGYPDISAQSVDYVIAYDQEFYLVSGTSASSPTVAGMISMINYGRIQAGKESLGFLNPTLYGLYDENPSYYFNDVISGYNLGCSVDSDIGWYAAEGWDPITGCGSPKFSRLYEALLAAD